mmetsp:Transcript_2969/g.8011  ORF Transcript_2969/g.8011 Transcript_2969/m.8011 type:complete len:316 (-) Transcript_2969:1050-1997(-)
MHGTCGGSGSEGNATGIGECNKNERPLVVFFVDNNFLHIDLSTRAAGKQYVDINGLRVGRVGREHRLFRDQRRTQHGRAQRLREGGALALEPLDLLLDHHLVQIDQLAAVDLHDVLHELADLPVPDRLEHRHVVDGIDLADLPLLGPAHVLWLLLELNHQALLVAQRRDDAHVETARRKLSEAALSLLAGVGRRLLLGRVPGGLGVLQRWVRQVQCVHELTCNLVQASVRGLVRDSLLHQEHNRINLHDTLELDEGSPAHVNASLQEVLGVPDVRCPHLCGQVDELPALVLDQGPDVRAVQEFACRCPRVAVLRR